MTVTSASGNFWLNRKAVARPTMPPPTTSALVGFRTSPIIGYSCEHDGNHQKTALGSRARLDCLTRTRRGAIYASPRSGAIYRAQHPARGGGPDAEIDCRDRISRSRAGPRYSIAYCAAAEAVRPQARGLPHRNAVNYRRLEAVGREGCGAENH